MPAYNELENIEPLVRRIRDACAAHGLTDYEMVFVENGSWDGSEALLRRLHEEDPRVQMVRLSRNFGYQGAISTGLKYATKEWVALLDGDQQDPPELVLEMLVKALGGFDVVYGVRTKRQEHFFKRLSYKLYYRFLRSMADTPIPLDAGEFGVMHRKVVDVINSLPERQRFTRGLRAWVGFRQAPYEYDRDARAEGKTKFNLYGMISLAFDGLFAFSIVPIRMMIWLGAVVVFLSLVLNAVTLVAWIASQFGYQPLVGLMPLGLTQLSLVFSLILGFIILGLGVIGEYVGRIYEEVKARPISIVAEVLAGTGAAASATPAPVSIAQVPDVRKASSG